MPITPKCADTTLLAKLMKPGWFETSFTPYVVDEMGECASKSFGASYAASSFSRRTEATLMTG